MIGLAGTKRPRVMMDAYAAAGGAGGPADGAPSILYYSGQICNGGVVGSVADDPVCEGIDARGTPLLADAAGYYAAFVRLHVNGTLYLPAFRPVITPAQPDINLTIYSVTLTARWRGALAAPAAVDIAGPPAARSFYIGARSAVDGMPLMTPYLCTMSVAGPISPATLCVAMQAEVAFFMSGNPTSPWGPTALPGMFAIPSGTQRIVFTPPSGATDILTIQFVDADAARLCGATVATYAPAAPSSPVLFPNYPNSNPAAVLASPDFVSQVFVRWIPEDVTDPALPAPPGPGGMDNASNPGYYLGYSYDHVAGLFNTALAAAAADIVAQFGAWWAGAGGALPAPPLQASAPPRLTYDASSKLFSLTVPSYGYGPQRTSAGRAGPGGSEEWSMAFNTNAFNLFSSFPAVFERVLPTNAGRDVTVSFGGAAAAPGAPGAWVLYQGYVSTDAFWSPVGAIGVQSTYISALEQARAPPITLGTSSVVMGPTTATTSFDRTVVDFTVAGATATDARTTVTYVPEANYRFLEMRPGAIESVDVRISWIDRLTGESFPLRLPPQASCTYVIAFFHKSAM